MTDQPGTPRSSSDVDTRTLDPASQPTLTIGAYRLLQCVGEGGMGQVWRAEQLAPVRRQVALKVLKAGMDTEHVMARFEAERQALAVMNHPAIAKVLDAGATPEGRPYFVLEYVPGEAITSYCNRHQLSTRKRLDLLLKVCEGVEHAHQKGVIHRDLKPSNILVTLLDGQPVPKIIDFGVAKAIAQPLVDRPLYTEVGSLIGTPEYMSPEQAEGLDIDTRTDVYALGVVLYELLTGILPFDSKALRQQGLDAIRRTIREVEPPRPSTRVSQSAAATTTDNPRPSTAILARELRGDLDWITMRALEKDRSRRYGSAADLAADVRRHVNHQPVSAGPPSTSYRALKFVRRHRVGVTVAATLVALLAAFAVTVAIQARRISIERDRANREADIATAVSDFLQGDLLAQASANQQAGPNTKPDPDLTVRTALDRAAARIEGKFEGEPLVEAAIRQTMATTYRDLGLYPQGQRQADQAFTLRKQVLGDEHPDTLRTATELVLLHRRQGHYPEAEALATSVLEIQRRVRGEEHADTGNAMSSLHGLYQDQQKYALAEPLATGALEISRRTNGEESPETLTRMNNLALLYQSMGKLEEAEPLLSSALAIRRRVSGAEHPETLTLMNNLASQLYRRGRYADAERLFGELIEIRRRVLGNEHPSTLIAMNNLAVAYRAEGKYAEAEPIVVSVLEIRGRVLGEDHPDTLRSAHALAGLHALAGRDSDAEALFAKVLEARRRKVGAEAPDTLSTMSALGRVRLQQGKFQDATAVLSGALKGYERAMPQSWERYNCEALLGASLAATRRFAEAEPLLASGFEGMAARRDAATPEMRSQMADAGAQIIKLYTDWNRADRAAEWTEKVQRSAAPTTKP
jgi:serine/threonine protein kinase/tetratricopeptide (TPR) repeat protein